MLEKRNTFRDALFSAILVFQIESTFSQPAVQDETWVITSPDESIRTTVSLRESPSDATFTWSVTRNEFAILDSCQLGLRTPEGDLLHQAKLTQSTNHEVRERVPILFGKAAYGDNAFNETRFQFATTQDRLVEIQFRCYNDAVAFRYLARARSRDHSLLGNQTREPIGSSPHPGVAQSNQRRHHRSVLERVCRHGPTKVAPKRSPSYQCLKPQGRRK